MKIISQVCFHGKFTSLVKLIVSQLHTFRNVAISREIAFLKDWLGAIALPSLLATCMLLHTNSNRNEYFVQRMSVKPIESSIKKCSDYYASL